MDSEVQGKVFIRACALVGLFGSPILLVLFLRAPNPSHDRLGPLGYALMIGFCIFAFFFSAWICRREFGWFGGKKGG